MIYLATVRLDKSGLSAEILTGDADAIDTAIGGQTFETEDEFWWMVRLGEWTLTERELRGVLSVLPCSDRITLTIGHLAPVAVSP